MKINVKNIIKKKGVEKIAMITAYDALFARLADQAGADIILVGDSLGNVVLGFDSTIPVTIEHMVHHTAAVSRANTNALVLADVPFGVAHFSFDSLLHDCRRLVQEAGAQAVKIEGGKEMADKIAKLVNAGIPVMAHIGLQPQQFIRMGGYRKFGKTPQERQQILDDAKALEDAGAFAILLEMTDEETASMVTQAVSVPTIGIGAGAGCDGQVLVCADILGLSDSCPSFVKKYLDGKNLLLEAYKNYVADVREKKFP